MNFDPNNLVVKLCTEGMTLEGEGKTQEALQLFKQAWDEASNNFEKFTAAHYVARLQETLADKLGWDQIALDLALQIQDESIKASLPSLYLNVGKGYECLHDHIKAKEHYQLAHNWAEFLPDDDYGNMINGGIKRAIERTH
ncbi:rRNA adenine methyltransferase [Mucilaginibacter arboris]|uniref:rRNA adenine methyltransferase n=1 Tax=Mucilaginibacter arboris TaxID=2682090 RepID=A0A7K1STU8_9SPHI|nr:rRNA adenine methyltransferase [Mucilaginibacter arboris]MVN20752.1 rRNA adenine methyltransferase [Mucilaginibacter arboris]